MTRDAVVAEGSIRTTVRPNANAATPRSPIVHQWRPMAALMSRRFAKVFAAEPRIGSEGTQGQILQTFVDLDFMHAAALPAVPCQNPQCCLFAIGRGCAPPHDHAVGGRRRFG